MLPVVVYNVDDADYHLLMEQLQACAASTRVDLRVELYTRKIAEAVSAVRRAESIFLLISGVEGVAADGAPQGLKLGRLVMNQNRDNYAVFITRDRRSMEDVMCLCIRPAGVMVAPLDKRRIAALFRQILTDFFRLDSRHPTDGAYIVCKVGGALHRVNIRDVVYMQALDKRIEICTGRQSIYVYKSMAEMLDMLGESFIKCHRSYAVNLARIERVDSPDMLIHMQDGSRIPLSRSCRDAVCRALLGKEDAV